jgi:glycosyltransferase involved in cell wall biosynthesis
VSDSDARIEPPRVRAAFVLEQTLGHVTHSQNLCRLLDGDRRLDMTPLLIDPTPSRRFGRLPGMSNWTVLAGVRARRAVRLLQRRGPVDVMFVHTQVPAVLLGRWMRRLPTVVSLDATPVQYDSLGPFYAHEVSAAPVERLKKVAQQRCFRRAGHLVTWSAWAGDSLVTDYGVSPDRITVIAPGVDVALWQRHEPRQESTGRPVRILFVGGDLQRKGGDLLLEAAHLLGADPSLPAFELHLVTRADVPEAPGVYVHRLGPNSPELVALYHSCDIFCLPTLGDCLPMVLSEAGVAELALIATDVGAISEIVRHEQTGLLIPPGDQNALTAALRLLISEPAVRRRLGCAAADLVRRDYSAADNAQRLVDVLLAVAHPPAAAGSSGDQRNSA